MGNNDTKVVEQKELVVDKLLVDEIRDKKTGKLIAKNGEIEDVDYDELNVNEITAKDKLEVGSSGALGDNLKSKIGDYVGTNFITLPDYPATTEDKTYVLKLVNGTLTWVEEVPDTPANPGEE